MRKILVSASLLFGVCAALNLFQPALAAPPVRVGVVPGGGSGIEQEIVDRISDDLGNDPNITLSTVNPDWMVVCNIHESVDQVSGAIRYNGNVVVKTADGQVINTVAVQKYNQDFSLQPGAPLNKKLVDNAARDVIAAASQRAVGPIHEAARVEMETRDTIIAAQEQAAKDDYDNGINTLREVSPDSPHFKAVQQMIAEFAMEKAAMEAVNNAQAKAKQGRYMEAITLLKEVPKQSKRFKLATERITSYKVASARLAKNKQGSASNRASATTPSKGADAQKSALSAQQRALEAQARAIEAQQAAIKSGK